MSCTVACECVSGYVRAKVRAWAYANIGYIRLCASFSVHVRLCAFAHPIVCTYACMRGGMYQCSGLHAYEHV